MKMPHDMHTLTEAVEKFREHGYDKDFEFGKGGMTYKDSEKVYKPNELLIRRVYRFEGMSDPADMSVIYGIEANDGSKGIYIDAYGTYGDNDPLTTAEFLKNVKMADDHGDHDEDS